MPISASGYYGVDKMATRQLSTVSLGSTSSRGVHSIPRLKVEHTNSALFPSLSYEILSHHQLVQICTHISQNIPCDGVAAWTLAYVNRQQTISIKIDSALVTTETPRGRHTATLSFQIPVMGWPYFDDVSVGTMVVAMLTESIMTHAISWLQSTGAHRTVCSADKTVAEGVVTIELRF